MNRVYFIRRVGGRVVERGNAREDDYLLLKKGKTGYALDDGTTPLDLPPPIVFPEPEPTGYPTIEKLTDAVLKLADGDRGPLDAIKADVAARKRNASAKRTVSKRRTRRANS